MLPSDHRYRQQITAVELLAVGRQRVYLVFAVRGPDIAAAARSRSGDFDENNTAVAAGPLALHAQDSGA